LLIDEGGRSEIEPACPPARSCDPSFAAGIHVLVLHNKYVDGWARRGRSPAMMSRVRFDLSESALISLDAGPLTR